MRSFSVSPELPVQLAAAADCDGDQFCSWVFDVTNVAWLAESSTWIIIKPLRILLILIVALLVRWIAHRMIRRLTRFNENGEVPVLLRPLRERVPTALQEATGLLSERRRQRAETIGSVLRNVVSITVFTLAIMLILGELGINLGPLLASAGIVGVALGFGAQSLVRDVISGMFMLVEDQYGVGDVVDLGEASGTVEAVGLRVTTLRDVHGVVWYVRNGEILRVGNRSQGWAQVVVDVPIGFSTPIDNAVTVIKEAAETLAQDPEWERELIGPPEVWGVEQITLDGATVRVAVKTVSDSQWKVGRELRRRLTERLTAEGIAAQIAPGRVYVRASSPTGQAPGQPAS